MPLADSEVLIFSYEVLLEDRYGNLEKMKTECPDAYSHVAGLVERIHDTVSRVSYPAGNSKRMMQTKDRFGGSVELQRFQFDFNKEGAESRLSMELSKRCRQGLHGGISVGVEFAFH